MTSVSGPNIVTSGLVLWLDAADPLSYPGSGSTWYDLSGNGYTTTLNGPPTFSSANYGAFSFNGVSSTNAYSPTLGTLLNNGFTYEMWFNSSASSGVLLTEEGAATLNTAWYDSNIEIVSGSIRLGFWVGSQASMTVSSINTSQWYMITMTYSGTTLSGYLNGAFITNATYTKQNPNTNNLYLVMGAASGTTMGSGASFNGTIGSFKAYSRALTSAEITQNFNSLRYRYGI